MMFCEIKCILFTPLPSGLFITVIFCCAANLKPKNNTAFDQFLQ